MCRHTTPPACYLKYLHEGHSKGSLQGSLKNKDMVLLHMYLSMKNWDAVSACAAHSDWTGVTLTRACHCWSASSASFAYAFIASVRPLGMVVSIGVLAGAPRGGVSGVSSTFSVASACAPK